MPRTQVEATCHFCHQNHRVRQDYFKAGGGKYCSRKCFNLARTVKLDMEQVKDLIQQGMSGHKIAATLGVSQHAISKYLKRNQLTTRARSGPVRQHKRYTQCFYCQSSLSKTQKKYCSKECLRDYRYHANIALWKKGSLTGGSPGKVAPYVRRYLIEARGESCEQCAWNTRHTITDKVPLEVHHINRHDDHSEANLQLLCPNCHSLTLSFRGLNRGKGRKYRRFSTL